MTTTDRILLLIAHMLTYMVPAHVRMYFQAEVARIAESCGLRLIGRDE